MSDAKLVPNFGHFNASLPDFNNVSSLGTSDALLPPVELLRTFIAQPFRLPVPHHFVLQMEIAVAIITLLLLMACAVVWRRWSEKCLWVVRRQERRDGVLLVPNAVTSFMMLEFLFGSVWICYAVDQIRVVKGHAPPTRLVLWLGLTWVPLIQGAWFAGWGTFFASPLQPGATTLDGTPVTRKTKKKVKLFPSPFGKLNAPALNVIMVGVPLLHMSTIATFTGLASKKWEVAVQQWDALDLQLLHLSSAAHASADPVASGQVTVDVRQEAVAVWSSADVAMSGLENVWWCWVASAIAFTAFYCLTGGALLLQLRREVTFLKRAIFHKMQAANERAGKGSVDDIHTDIVVQERTDTVNVSFWPKVTGRQSILRKMTVQSSSSSGSRRHSKGGIRNAKLEMMRRVVHLIGVQVICISIAAAGFSLLALALALGIRRSVRDHHFTMLYTVCNLVAAWTACIFGGAIFFAITARTFEFLTDYILAAAQAGRGGGRSDNEDDGEKDGRSGRLVHSKSHHGPGGDAQSSASLTNLKSGGSRSKGAGGKMWQSPAASQVPFQGEDSILVPRGEGDDDKVTHEDGNSSVGLALATSPVSAHTFGVPGRSFPSSPVSIASPKVRWVPSSLLNSPRHERTVWQDDSIIIGGHELQEHVELERPPSSSCGEGGRTILSEPQGNVKVSISRKICGTRGAETNAISEEDSLYVPCGEDDVERGGLSPPPPPRRAKSSRSTEALPAWVRTDTQRSSTIPDIDATSPRLPARGLRRSTSMNTCTVQANGASPEGGNTTIGGHRSFGYRSPCSPIDPQEGHHSEDGFGLPRDPLGATSLQIPQAAACSTGRPQTHEVERWQEKRKYDEYGY